MQKLLERCNQRGGILFESEHEFGLLQVWASTIIGAVLFALLLASLEPGGPMFETVFHGWMFWSAYTVSAFSLVVLLERCLVGSSLKRAERVVFTIIVTSVCVTPVSMIAGHFFGVSDPTEAQAPGFYLQAFVEWREIIREVAISSAIFYFIAGTTLHSARSKQYWSDQKSRISLSQQISEIPVALGENLIRMSAHEHYTEIVTSQGSTLILRGLADCVAQLESFDGLQIHRSHWVSLEHVMLVQKRGSSFEVVLSNRDKVPLSRRKYSEVRHILRARFHFV